MEARKWCIIMKKMIVSDYDQTFYINDQDMEINKEVVSKFINFGNLFVIATGRSYFDFKTKLELYQFPYHYAILNHGATIIDCNNHVLVNIPIETNIPLEIEQDLALEKSTNYFCCSNLESRVDFSHDNLTKINVKYESYDLAMKQVKFINNKYQDYVKAYYVNNNSIEIISKEVNKAKAISYIMNLENVVEENIYTIGDGYSDIEMIKKYKGYCMENSIEELKKYAICEYNSVSSMLEDILQEKI